jgi:hypothetical protein
VNSAVANPSTYVFAEESHASRAMALLMVLLPGAAFGVLANKAPSPVMWVFLIVLVPVLFGAVLAWSGFRYRFSAAGVDISTLGFRLRRIAAADICNYSTEPWSALQGYGIRGIGGRKAYVWGNRVVRIETTSGVVFLGHDEPEKIVRDLDLVTRHDASVGS